MLWHTSCTIKVIWLLLYLMCDHHSFRYSYESNRHMTASAPLLAYLSIGIQILFTSTSLRQITHFSPHHLPYWGVTEKSHVCIAVDLPSLCKAKACPVHFIGLTKVGSIHSLFSHVKPGCKTPRVWWDLLWACGLLVVVCLLFLLFEASLNIRFTHTLVEW